MSALRTEATKVPAGDTPQRRAATTQAKAALVLGIASSVAFAAAGVFTTTTDGGGKFRYAADYWYTANGIPSAIAEITLLLAVLKLQGGRGGRLALAGTWIANVAMAVLIVMLASSVAIGAETPWGPTYVLATFATFVGHALFSAGSWRVGLFPRWMLGVWPVVWVIGSFAAQGASPLLLTAFYVLTAVVVLKRQSTKHQQ